MEVVAFSGPKWGQDLNNIRCEFRVIFFVVNFFALSSCSGMQDLARVDLTDEMQVALKEASDLNDETYEVVYETSSFSDALKVAVDASPSVQSLKKAERAVESQLLALKSQTEPQVTSNARAGVVRYDNAASESTAGIALNVLLSQLVYDGGFVAGSIDAAEAQLSLAKSQTAQEVNKVAKDAAFAWVSLWEAQESFTLFADLREEIINNQNQAKRMSDVGLVDRSILDSVERKFLAFELKRADAESSLRSAQMAYARYFKYLPAKVDYPELPVSYNNVETRLTDEIINPSIRVAALQLIIDKKNVEVKRSEFSPQVFFQVGVDSPISASETANLRGGINVKYTIMDGGKREAELSAAEENVRSKRHALNAIRQETEVLSKLLLERYENALTSEVMVRKSVESAKERFTVAESQIQTGKSNIVELVEARYQYVLSEVDLLNKIAQKERLKLELIELLGLYED